jgi:hypothetical protein
MILAIAATCFVRDIVRWPQRLADVLNLGLKLIGPAIAAGGAFD